MTAIIAGRRPIGAGHPCYVIAELSANHGGDLDRAVELVQRAAEAGADAVKLQTYRADTLTIDCGADPFVVSGGTPWDGRTLFDLYGEAFTPWEWHPQLQREAANAGVDFFSAPFDDTAVDLLVGLGVPMLKIASFELVDHELIRYAAATGKPLLLSTGMATAEEIDDAVGVAREAGADALALLRCNSAYPAPAAEMDLRTIPDMAARWDVPIGFSDHTLGIAAAVTAVTLGACLLEKHLTLSRGQPTPDSAFSLEPHEFRAMVDAVRDAEAALGSVRYGPSTSESSSLVFRRSLFAVADIAEGELFSEENVRAIRPGYGLPPKGLSEVLGRRSTRAIERGTPLSSRLVTPGD